MICNKTKKQLVFILLFSISFLTAQTTPKVAETEKKEAIVKQEKAPNSLDEKGLRHGLWNGFYDDSKILRYVGNFNHGVETGLFTYYANSDKKIVMATRNFDSKNNAYTIFFDENKNKVSEGNTVNKLRQGIWKYYHKNSKVVMTTENYIKDKLEGIRKVFYQNGKLAEELAYKNNLKEGVSKKYSEKGILIEETEFSKGLMNGSYKVYDEFGKIEISGQFRNDAKKGIWKYYEKGKLIKEENKNIQKKSTDSEKRKPKSIENK